MCFDVIERHPANESYMSLLVFYILSKKKTQLFFIAVLIPNSNLPFEVRPFPKAE